MDQYWSWILTAVGLTGFVLAGKKIWWCWYINIACQGLWMTYAIVTEQWGFIVASLAYTFVFTKNAIKWTKEHRLEQDASHRAFQEYVKYAKADVGVTRAFYDYSVRGAMIPTVEVRKDECLADYCKKGPLSCGYCMAHCLCGIGK